MATKTPREKSTKKETNKEPAVSSPEEKGTSGRDSTGPNSASLFFTLIIVLAIIIGLVYIVSQKKKDVDLERQLSTLQNKIEVGLTDVKQQVGTLEEQQEQEKMREELEKRKGKKYTGALYDYSLYYPEQYAVAQVSTNFDEVDKEFVIFMRKSDLEIQKNLEASEGGPTVSFHVMNNPSGLTPIEWVAVREHINYSNYDANVETSVQTIGGKEFLMYTITGLGQIDYFITPFGQDIFLGAVSYTDENDQIRKDIVKMLEQLGFNQ